MPHSFLLPFLSGLLSFCLNYFSHHHLFISLINSLTLGLAIYLFQNFLNLKKSIFNNFLILSSGLIPLFFYSSNYIFFSFLPLTTLGLFYLYKKFPAKFILLIWILFLLLANLYLGEVIKYPFQIQHSQLIFNSPEVNYHLNRHQEDALFIPYRLRLLLYSKLIYVYALLTNFFDFLNLKNLYDVLLLANLYPIFIGSYKIFIEKGRFKYLIFSSFFVTILTSGVDRSADKFQSLYLLAPIFIYLILKGSQHINKKVYLILWALSFYIFINPKI